MFAQERSALKARFKSTHPIQFESRFQRSFGGNDDYPGAMPQAKNEERRWRSMMTRAGLVAINARQPVPK
jgi:hypothetical protein